MCMYWEGSALLMVGLDRTGRSSTWSWCPKDSVYTKASIMSSLLSSSHSHRSTDVMMMWTIMRGSIGDIHPGWKPCSCQPLLWGFIFSRILLAAGLPNWVGHRCEGGGANICLPY